MKFLSMKAFGGLIFLLIVMGGLLFIPAGIFDYWQAWTFLTVFGCIALAITVYLMIHDRNLLERRVQAGPTAEKDPTQKIIQSLTSLGFIAMLVVPALDRRYGWSAMPAWLSIAGNLMLTLGFFIIFFVYKENTYASATIEIVPGQKVISTGLYALVRHPMYMGGMVWLTGMSLCLGSWWGTCILILLSPALVWRLLTEEKFLSANLEGYNEYRNKIRFRLIPFVW